MSMWSWGFSVISLFIAENVMAVEDLFEKNAELGVGVDCQNLEVIYKLKNKGRGYLDNKIGHPPIEKLMGKLLHIQSTIARACYMDR
ncbi:hypothetical protein [Microbulbifer thermotolerans]|uniref:hypothetical protein n=1 Tax=Microbulbifer thermotolerans TaxID=252514 RepID=UPI000B0691FE|nr:hypothetical protein [Microbulbifer thermotolerans]